MAPDPRYAFGPFVLDPGQHQLSRDGQPLRLTPKAFELLQILVEAHGQLIHKERLMERLWPNTFVEDSNLTFNVYQLRKILGDGEARRYIENVPKKGYRFCAPTRVLDDPPLTIERPVVASDSAPAVDPPVTSRSSTTVRLGVVTFLVSLMAVATGLGVRTFRARHHNVTLIAHRDEGVQQPRRAVAVLEPKNMSGQPALAWVAPAIAEMLSTELAAGGKVRVVSRENIADLGVDSTPASGQAGAGLSLRQIGSRLGADALVLGSYAAVGSSGDTQIRVDARIEDPHTGETVAAVAERGDLTNLFAIVSRVGSRLREALQLGDLKFDALTDRASMPASAASQRFYIEGLSKLRATDALAAKPLLQKVVDADPAFALGHSRLAEAWNALGYDSRAQVEAKRAFDLSGSLSQDERLRVEASFRTITHEWALASDVFQRLLDFYPDDIECALQLAEVQTRAGQPRKALSTIEQFRRWPSPLGDDWRLDLAEAAAAHEVGDLGRELQLAQRAEQKTQSGQDARAVAYARVQESRAYKALGRIDDAFRTLTAAEAFFSGSNDQLDSATSLVDLATYMRDAGRVKEREALYHEAQAVYTRLGNKKGEAQVLNNIGGMLEETGKFDEARKAYQQSLAIRRIIDDRRGIGTSLNNLGDISQTQGDLAGAERSYQDALAVFQGAELHDATALALGELGEIKGLRGDLVGAKILLEQSVGEWRDMNARTFYATGAWISLGDVRLASGDLKEARQAYTQGLSFLTDAATRVPASEARLHVADVLIEEGRPAEAESTSRASRAVFHTEGTNSEELAADVSLAKALLAQAKTSQAAAIMNEARHIPALNTSPLFKLDFDIVQARIEAATPEGRSRAAKSLRESRRLAEHYGSVAHRLRIDLVLADLLAQGSRPDQARAALTSVWREASARGFALVARKANSVLRELQSDRVSQSGER